MDKKWVITWDCGYGEMADIITADSLEKAEEAAYENWRDAAESEAKYEAQPYTEELAEEYGL